MPDIIYTPPYAVWKNKPDTTTPITAAVMQHIDSAFAEVYAQANLALNTANTLGGGTGLLPANNLSDVANVATSRNNLKTAYIVTPEQYGAKGDGTTDDTASIQAAIDALAALGGGTILFTSLLYIANGLVLKSGVYLKGLQVGRFGGSTGKQVQISPTVAWAGGWVIDTPATQIYNAGVEGIAIVCTPPSSGASPLIGGIRFQLATWCKVEGCNISGTSLGSLKITNGVACFVNNCNMQNIYTYRTLSAVEGVISLGGTDHVVAHCQFNAGDAATVTDATNFYRCAMHVNTWTAWIHDCNGEFADCGIRVTGYANKFSNCRADVNAGRGIMVDGLYNQFENTTLVANSQASSGTYDGIYITSLGLGCSFTNVGTFTFGTNPRHRYLINDQTGITDPDHAIWWAPKIYGVHGDENAVELDFYNALIPYHSIQPSGASIRSARPGSRYCAGLSWWDSTNKKVAYSDGSRWRDDTGVIDGNMLHPNFATHRDGASHYNVAGGSATVSIVDGRTVFKKPKAMRLTTSAAGVTAGYAAVQINDYMTEVVAGQTYTGVVYTKAGTRAGNVNFGWVWFDASNVQVGAVVYSTAAANNTSTATKYLPASQVAPAGAVKLVLQVFFSATGLTAGDTWDFTKLAVIPGTTPPTDYIEP